MAKFGFLLSRSPHVGRNLHTLYGLASAALEKDHDVFIYLGFDAVFSPLKNQKRINGELSPRDMISDLIHRGAEVVCGNLDIVIRGIDSNKFFIEGVKTGELADFAERIATIDRLITL